MGEASPHRADGISPLIQSRAVTCTRSVARQTPISCPRGFRRAQWEPLDGCNASISRPHAGPPRDETALWVGDFSRAPGATTRRWRPHSRSAGTGGSVRSECRSTSSCASRARNGRARADTARSVGGRRRGDGGEHRRRLGAAAAARRVPRRRAPAPGREPPLRSARTSGRARTAWVLAFFEDPAERDAFVAQHAGAGAT